VLSHQKIAGIAALACVFALSALSGPAYAEITGFSLSKIEGADDLSLSDRFGTGANDTRHMINISDCEAYAGGSATFSVRVDDAPSGYVYGVAYAGPGKTCPTTHASFDGAVTDDCFVVEQDEELPSGEFSFDVSLDWLTGGDCDAGTNTTARVYIVIEDPNLDSTDENQQFDIIVDLDPPGAPELTEVSPGDRRLDLSWTDESNTDDVTYTVYWDDESLVESDLSGALSETGVSTTSYAIEDDTLDNGVPYVVAIAAVDEAENESGLSNHMIGTPIETLDFWELYQSNGGTDPGGYCFIATAAWGHPMATHLGALRSFRDQVLMPTTLGQAFVERYYRWGRFAAAFIAPSPVARFVTRVVLVPLVWLAQWTTGATPFGFWVLLGALALLWRGRRPTVTLSLPTEVTS
jgi:hypothetical protein